MLRCTASILCLCVTDAENLNVYAGTTFIRVHRDQVVHQRSPLCHHVRFQASAYLRHRSLALHALAEFDLDLG
ncbi:hypothetical protein DE146DRAFT_668630 [Phaeosphaeria sp. MPI-PUGE-AT-0046c]|nr:hypothetical protein DE146DRAFT_668630 [Phaeosphaeria sp. MPI-PUGE-AT-0046c]